MKTPPQNLQRREIAEVSELNVFEYLQNSEESDDLIQKDKLYFVYESIACDFEHK